MTGNTALVEHGITTEASDLRAHVCPGECSIYVFPTKSGVVAVNSNQYAVVSAHQPNVEAVTAEGCWVPPDDISQCVRLSPRSAAWKAMRFSADDPCSEKGRKAVRFVKMIKSL